MTRRKCPTVEVLDYRSLRPTDERLLVELFSRPPKRRVIDVQPVAVIDCGTRPIRPARRSRRSR